MRIGGERITQFILHECICQDLNLEHMLVPRVGDVNCLYDALMFDVNRTTSLSDTEVEGNFAEGVVIRPYIKDYVSRGGSTFILKKKHPKFAEKNAEKKPKVIREDLAKLNLEFRGYINKNRIESVFSKEGEIEDIKQIGKYIKLALADAREDFVKDYEDEIAELDKGELKKVFNVGGVIANLLKEYL